MKSVFALIPAALLAGTILAAPAEAKRKDDPTQHAERVSGQKKHFKARTQRKSGEVRKVVTTKKVLTVKARKVVARAKARTRHLAAKPRKVKPFANMAMTRTIKPAPQRVSKLSGPRKSLLTDQGLRIEGASDMRVASIIREMAPSYGVPTWFALRIASVESGFNPYARGRAGEIGVYQLKCQTARGMGFSGTCSGLTDARTNVRWGLKHLSLAIQSSSGNLRLAASKHNGGLGRKSLVQGYVAKVF